MHHSFLKYTLPSQYGVRPLGQRRHVDVGGRLPSEDLHRVRAATFKLSSVPHNITVESLADAADVVT